MYDMSVFLRRWTIWRWLSGGGFPESPLCGRSLSKMCDLSLERLPLISALKSLWWTLTSHSFDMAFLFNQFEYFLCFVLFPPFAIFALKLLLVGLLLVGGLLSSNSYFTECYSKLVVTTRTRWRKPHCLLFMIKSSANFVPGGFFSV